METLITILVVLILVPLTVVPYIRKMKRKEREAHEAREKGKVMSGKPQAQHPHIDITKCIGCGTCVTACPEGDVLAVIGGKSTIINGYKCIGHGLCADACPVGAIEIVMATPSASADMPVLTSEYETSIPNLFIVGELGGLALIKNAVNQGRDCVNAISAKMKMNPAAYRSSGSIVDVLIVGAGPAGISASLCAIQNKLSYLTLEQDDIGGTVRQYPRQKLVMTSPVELPMYGKFKKIEITKEALLELWEDVFRRCGLKVQTQEKVQEIIPEAGGFRVVSTKGEYHAQHVILALGKRGTPRKLGAEGEHLEKVYYRLIEADHYKNNHILVVGGGDSAVEAAMGLATQEGNNVVLSYRGNNFSRIKDRNAKRIQEWVERKKIELLFQSNVKKITPESVHIDVQNELRELRNDYVWIFAGGEPPTAFMQKIGVKMGITDVTEKKGEIA